RGTLRELLHRDRDRLLELWVVALPDELRIHLDLDVRRDAPVLDLPLAVQAVDRDPRRRHASAVEELRVIVDTHEPAPRAGADDRPDARAPEEPGQRIAARPGHLVREHHLRALDRRGGARLLLAVARDHETGQRTPQVVHDVVRHVSALVEALVDDRALPSDL